MMTIETGMGSNMTEADALKELRFMLNLCQKFRSDVLEAITLAGHVEEPTEVHYEIAKDFCSLLFDEELDIVVTLNQIITDVQAHKYSLEPITLYNFRFMFGQHDTIIVFSGLRDKPLKNPNDGNILQGWTK